jgi:hypothetical protein
VEGAEKVILAKWWQVLRIEVANYQFLPANGVNANIYQ